MLMPIDEIPTLSMKLPINLLLLLFEMDYDYFFFIFLFITPCKLLHPSALFYCHLPTKTNSIFITSAQLKL